MFDFFASFEVTILVDRILPQFDGISNTNCMILFPFQVGQHL